MTTPAAEPLSPNSNPADALAQVRRRDRAVTDEHWIRTFLQHAPVGVLATVDGDQPFLHPNFFVYDQAAHALYFHTALTGRTRSNADAGGEEGARACFSVMEMGRLLPAPQSLEFSVEYASVIVFGRVRVVTDRDEGLRALQGLLDKYVPHLHPGEDYRPPVDAELKRTAVYRLDIDAWSGKKKEAAPDFPGAYRYPDRPMLPSAAWE
jgi:uncharacterized protein